jgi:hypothetical protein
MEQQIPLNRSQPGSLPLRLVTSWVHLAKGRIDAPSRQLGMPVYKTRHRDWLAFQAGILRVFGRLVSAHNACLAVEAEGQVVLEKIFGETYVTESE